MEKEYFVGYHILEALSSGIAEINGDENLARHLRDNVKLRLMNMSEMELRQLALLLSCPPERPAELVYKGIKEDIEEHRATIREWINDLGEKTGQGGKG